MRCYMIIKSTQQTSMTLKWNGILIVQHLCWRPIHILDKRTNGECLNEVLFEKRQAAVQNTSKVQQTRIHKKSN